ncbi:MAG: nitroreductase family protein [Lachnospiraceae bacterium]|nr:nitroreductase family protein [Lachnospiraceae bacterium]MBQ8947860.1 nitroreductase family protein [Lachnospiraceae bacterium]
MQYETIITKYYHAIEKGLAFTDYRAGFGRDNINTLIRLMEEYSQKYDVNSFCYKTSLCTLYTYVEKNRKYGLEDTELEKRINSLPGTANQQGGVLEFAPISDGQECNYESLVMGRHSIRHFSDIPVDMDILNRALSLAQQTPSACNRQGWGTIVIQDKNKISDMLNYQNGNAGFGGEIDVLLLVVAELQAFNCDREVFQPYVDGGMYAMRLLDSLCYHGIATCPLSAALTPEQEENVRRIAEINESEIPILFIGIGNYPETCQTTKSERHNPLTRYV